jgi:hypothetical protein
VTDAPLGVRLDLRGECNRCGLCCVVETPGGRAVCEHLRAEGGPLAVKQLGLPGASRCAVYERRLSGMAIRMLNGRGEVVQMSQCWKDAWQEDYAIARRIGQGCSLTIPVHEGQVTKFERSERG